MTILDRRLLGGLLSQTVGGNRTPFTVRQSTDRQQKITFRLKADESEMTDRRVAAEPDFFHQPLL